MSEIVDRKYIGMLSVKLDQFRQTSRDTWNFRCPLCGDSQKSKTKARGYLFAKAGRIFYHCHNCKAHPPFNDFLKLVDPSLYSNYLVDTFGPKPKKLKSSEAKVNMARLIKSVDDDIHLPTIESLPDNHPAKTFLYGRKIPKKYFSKLFFAEDFKKFVYDFWPECDKKLLENESRVIIPFTNAVGSIFGFQGRIISGNGIRYITIKPDAEATKVFGLDRLDFDKTIYVFEGPFDSLFVDNGLATMDSALYTAPKLINNEKGDYVFCYDCEPRNKEVLKSLRKSIRLGQKVVIWPREVSGLKDVNDMVLAGHDVKKIIDENTFSGLQADLEFNIWEKT